MMRDCAVSHPTVCEFPSHVNLLGLGSSRFSSLPLITLKEGFARKQICVNVDGWCAVKETAAIERVAQDEVSCAGFCLNYVELLPIVG